MKNKIKKCLLVLMSIVMVTVSISTGFLWGRVEAANSPYMMKLTPGGGEVYTSFELEENITYTLTCKYYAQKNEADTETTNGYVPIYFKSDLNPYGGRTEIHWVGYPTNQINTLSISYTTQSNESWLAISFANNTSATTLYYWDIEIHKGDGTENIMRNPGFQTGDGSWIGWQMEKYDNQAYIDSTEKSQAAETASGNQIIDWDESIGGSLVPYAWDSTAKTVTFTRDMSFNLSNINDYQLQKEGKVFIGWKKNGTYVTASTGSVDVVSGDVLTATYLDYDSNATGDFAIHSEEMRTDGALGLRFKVKLSDNLKTTLPNVIDYGTIVLPTQILNATWSDLIYGGIYTYNNNTYETAIVPGTNTYATDSDGIYYTLCMTGLTENKYDRQYTAKGYIRYTDNNGVERILYTDSVSTNPYLTSVNDLTQMEGNTTLEALISSVETTYQTERATLDESKQDYIGSSANPNTWVYQLSNGLRVREVNINTNKGGNAVEIMHLTDLHYAYLNELDIAEANPALLAEYEIRNQWPTIARGNSAKLAQKVLEYARTSDQIVVTGDALDFLSHGTVELLNRTIWDKYPNAMITVGNHEPEQAVAASVGEYLTMEQRVSWLTNAWKHDLYYSSKVIDDKVMIIQMNNSETKFYESQITPLTNDLATAKQKGYAVLIFMHEPLQTGNSEDTAVSAIRVDGYTDQADLKTLNFHDGNGTNIVRADTDDATTNIFNLIKSNADVIKGIFNGHVHTNFYTEIKAKTSSNEDAVIPQYTLSSSVYDSGYALKITVN